MGSRPREALSVLSLSSSIFLPLRAESSASVMERVGFFMVTSNVGLGVRDVLAVLNLPL